MNKRWLQHSILSAVGALGLLWAQPSLAQDYVTTFVPLSDGLSVLYEPAEPGDKAQIAVLQLHAYGSVLDDLSCKELAGRGYRALCVDGPFTNNEAGYAGYDGHAVTVKSGVDYLRALPDVTKVVLLGGSAGAPIMLYYQNVAENGADVCQAEARIVPCDPELVGELTAADGVILRDPHLGDAFATLTYTDPAITDETAPALRDASLDMFAAENGYDTKTNVGTYSDAFKATFHKAQGERNNRQIDAALALRQRMAAGEAGLYADDMPFPAFGGNAARLFQADATLLTQTKAPHVLLKADGSQVTEALHSVRVPRGAAADAVTYAGSTIPGSVNTFLGTNALRVASDYAITADDITGVQWESSNTSSPSNAEGITVPTLVMVMTGHYFIRPGEIILDHLAAADKELAGVEGAAHGITPCKPCEAAAGVSYGDTVKHHFDYIDAWLTARF